MVNHRGTLLSETRSDSMNNSGIVKYKILYFTVNKNRINRAFKNVPQKIPKQLTHFSKPEKCIIALTIVAILLVSAFGFLIEANKNLPTVEAVSNEPTPSPSPTQTTNPTSTSTPKPTVTRAPPRVSNPATIISVLPAATQKQPGIVESSLQMTDDVWKAIAANAWKYYQAGIGIDSTTGLPAAGIGYNHFTDWDLGVYIQAIIDAQKIGLIPKDGEWGASARLEKVMHFLETREINNITKVPFWFYNSDGTGYKTQDNIDAIDTGTLFVALHNLKIYEPSLASRINNFVYNSDNNRTNYAALIPGVKCFNSSASVYAYYFACGFAYFWPDELATVPDQILNNMYAGNVTTYNIVMPKADISCEPLLCAFFNQPSNPRIQQLMNETYTAHEARYNATGEYVAFSEGVSPYEFIWEWVVLANGDTWKITNGTTYIQTNPFIYTKISLSFLAIYNTTFAKEMSIYLERVLPEPPNGYYEGADFNADRNNAVVLGSVGSNTNGLILAAARYALGS